MSLLDTQKKAVDRHITEAEEKTKRIVEEAKGAIIPCGPRILVVREELLQKQGSLYLIQGEGDDTIPTRGEVLAIGEEVKNKNFEVGQTLYFGKYAGTTVSYQGKDFVLLQEHEALAIFKG